MTFLILQAGTPVAPLRRHGGFPHWIRVAAGLDADDAVAVDIASEPPPAPEGFAGAIVTGSAAMVSHRHDWSERAAGWLRDAARSGLPLFGGLSGSFAAHATHLQTVLEPPPAATVLARSAHDACQAFRWGDSAWGVQFHPEFSAAHMRGYVDARREALLAEGRDPRAMSRTITATPLARGLLRRFVAFART